MTYPVIGPLSAPIRTGGLTQCGHLPEDECRDCNGEAAEEREFWQATRKQRAAHLAGMAAWRRTQTTPHSDTGSST